MGKKVLYISQDFFGYEKIIKNSIEKYMGYKVFYLNIDLYRYSYKNILEKLYSNLVVKTRYKISLKEKKHIQNMIEVVEKQGKFDIIFCIKPCICPHGFMKYLKSKKIPMISHVWDSFSFVTKQKEYLKYFDKTSTFDEDEAKKYNLKFIPNFYIGEYIKKNEKIEYDVFTVMSYGSRFVLLEAFAKYLAEIGITYLFIVVTDKDIKSDYIKVQKEKISLEDNYKYISKSRAVLEIGHTDRSNLYQGGLSFRVFDVISNRKKLITSYELVKKFDFYNSNNIRVISDKEFEIEKEFFRSEYIELESRIYEEYSNKNWVKKIFDENF